MRNQEAEERSNARKERGQEERRVWRAMERAPEARRSTALCPAHCSQAHGHTMVTGEMLWPIRTHTQL